MPCGHGVNVTAASATDERYSIAVSLSTDAHNHARGSGPRRRVIDSQSDFTPILKTRTDLEERLRNKIAVLRQLRDRGIWLFDLSVVALYNPGGNKPPEKDRHEAMQIRWENGIGDLVTDIQSRHVICIGQAVAKAIRTQIEQVVSGTCSVMKQPQARLSRGDHLQQLREYGRLCVQHAP